MKGKYVIVRCRDAGVHAGYLVKYKGRKVVLKDSRRLWYWKAVTGHTLNAVAIHGIDDSESKTAGVVDKIILLEACEIIKCKKSGMESIVNAKEHNT